MRHDLARVAPRQESARIRFIRRLADVVVASAAIVVLLPLAIPLFIALRLTGEGWIFYRQKRVGYLNEYFDILKLATMLKNSPNMPGGSITVRKDPRITPLGGFLRLTKLNELPQFWNVLVGEMSIVGPRPLMQVSFDMYAPAVQAVVYSSRPGLTGIASVIFRDEEAFVSATDRDPVEFYRNVIYKYKGEIELWYHQNRSLTTDLKILLLTAWSLVAPSSALAFEWFPDLPLPPAELPIRLASPAPGFPDTPA